MESGLKNERLLLKINHSGSLSLKPRNEVGVNFFDNRDDEDGVISQPLKRPGYNLTLLRQSIDTAITELADIEEVELPDTVLREIYDDALSQITELNQTVSRLERENSTLETTVSNLEAEISNLKSSNDNLEILKAISDNQLEVINDRLVTVIEDLQSAIQRSIAESIQRASLQSRNELLISENNSLKEQLFGRQAQIEAGAVSSGTLFTVRALDISIPSRSPVYAEQEYSGGLFGSSTTNEDIQIKNGRRLELFNASTESLIVSSTLNREVGTDQWIATIGDITIEPQSTRVIELVTVKDWKRNRKSRTYRGSILFTASQGNVSEQITISTEIKRYRK